MTSRAPLASAPPVLLLSGEFDPVTPPAAAERVRRTLPGSLHLIVPGQSHGIETPCVTRIVAVFLAASSARDLDTSCLAALPPLPFELGP